MEPGAKTSSVMFTIICVSISYIGMERCIYQGLCVPNTIVSISYIGMEQSMTTFVNGNYIRINLLYRYGTIMVEQTSCPRISCINLLYRYGTKNLVKIIVILAYQSLI